MRAWLAVPLSVVEWAKSCHLWQRTNRCQKAFLTAVWNNKRTLLAVCYWILKRGAISAQKYSRKSIQRSKKTPHLEKEKHTLSLFHHLPKKTNWLALFCPYVRTPCKYAVRFCLMSFLQSRLTFASHMDLCLSSPNGFPFTIWIIIFPIQVHPYVLGRVAIWFKV
jgi:hypothetical protein